MKVLQLIDSLQAGGAERLAVNYANGLTKLGVNSFLCATRDEGPLLNLIQADVSYLFLNRKSTLDIKAIFRLRRFIKKNGINIIHAHSSSYFFATIVKMLSPKIRIVWHDHYGKSEMLNARPYEVMRFCSQKFSYIISVNELLKNWSQEKLRCPNVRYIKNFSVLENLEVDNVTLLQGTEGKRLLCVANLRAQKNHVMLLEAFKLVNVEFPDWTLHCVGKDFNDDYSSTFFKKVKELQLSDNVYFYNSRSDILNIMNQCQIGLLSSNSEGLPLTLIEYGLAGLPVVATDVGDCKKLISNASQGILVHENEETDFAEGIKKFINDEDFRLSCAKKFNQKVISEYSEGNVMSEIIIIYKSIL